MVYYWVFVWGLLGFGVPEGIALATGHGEWTLSETIWRLFDVIPGQTLRQWSLLHIIAACVMTWLYGHFIFGAWHVWRTHRHGG
jgi:hypothetical protein